MFLAPIPIDSSMYIYIIAVIAAIFIITIIFIILKKWNKKGKYQKKYLQLRNEYYEISKLPISDALSKLEVLAMRNISFSKLLTIFTNRYLDYNERYLTSINSKLDELKILIDERNYSKSNEAFSGVLIMIDAFKKEYNLLYEDINSSTAEEERLKDRIKKIKNEYLQCQKLYNDNSTDLMIVSDQIRTITQKIDAQIDECEDNLNAGIYLETSDILNEVKENLVYLNEYLTVMPNLIKWTSNGILKEYNDVMGKNIMMQAEFPLHHLMPIKRLEGIKIRIEESLGKIKVLDYQGLEAYLAELQKDIQQLNYELDQEKVARKEYDEACESLYYLSDYTNRNYVKCMKDVENLQTLYVATPELQSFIDGCKEMHARLSENKQNMDNNVYGHQPYSIRLKNMYELKTICEQFQKHLDLFAELVQNLCQEAEMAYGNISTFASLIRRTKIIIENCNIPAFTKKSEEKIKICEDLLAILGNALNKPVRLNITREVITRLTKECKELYGNAVYQQKLMLYCEKIIVMAAQQRMAFQAVDYGVNRASFYFNEGDFESARYTIQKLSNYNIILPPFEDIHQPVV